MSGDARRSVDVTANTPATTESMAAHPPHRPSLSATSASPTAPVPSGLPPSHDATAHVSPSSSAAAAAAAAARDYPTAPPPLPKIRRRNRLIQSCLECRRRKLKCSKTNPCDNCIKFHRDCLFLSPALDQASQLKLTEIKERVGSLERMLERDAARAQARASAVAATRHGPRDLADEADDDDEDDDAEADVVSDDEPRPWQILDAAYDQEADDDLLDLGFQLGKMRITERIGGFFRPKIAEELAFALNETSPHDSPEPSAAQGPVLSNRHLDSLKPGPTYIAPSAGFFFGNSSHHASLIDYLPSRLVADRLIEQYLLAVHPIARIVHRPSFERDYTNFWNHVSMGILPPSSVQAIVFAAMFSGVVSMDEEVINNTFGVSKSSLIDNSRIGTEGALTRANFLRSTKLQTLQAFIMYLIPLCRGEITRVHSVLVGAAIRAGECLGLHRDPEQFQMNAVESHVRRLIWYQLLFLDMRTGESQGPKPMIRADDFDCRPPLNVDDSELTLESGLTAPVQNDKLDRWTDMTFTLLRFECLEFMRTIWADRPRIERRKMTLMALLSKVEHFKAKLAAKYDHLFDPRIPIQKCAMIVKNIMVGRFCVMVLHVYHHFGTSKMPSRLHTLLIRNAILITENHIALERSPDLHRWAWYTGAYSQSHAAFLLLMDIFSNPSYPDAARVWESLNWVYDCDPAMAPQDRARALLTEMQEKTALYQHHRRMRAPVEYALNLKSEFPQLVKESQPPAQQPSQQPASSQPRFSPSSAAAPHTDPTAHRHSQSPSSHLPRAMSTSHAPPTSAPSPSFLNLVPLPAATAAPTTPRSSSLARLPSGHPLGMNYGAAALPGITSSGPLRHPAADPAAPAAAHGQVVVGVSDGETLWANRTMAEPARTGFSPEATSSIGSGSQAGGSGSGSGQPGGAAPVGGLAATSAVGGGVGNGHNAGDASGGRADVEMTVDIDWDAFDALFPQDQFTPRFDGGLDPTFAAHGSGPRAGGM